LLLLAARLCHLKILWAEEDLPLAAAAQMQAGKTLYRDIWFDKPPLLAAAYLPLRAKPGWPLRVAGALYGLLACAGVPLRRRPVGNRRARWAASLMAFFLIFDTPSAVTPLAADLLMLAPHLAAVYLSCAEAVLERGGGWVAFCINSKGLVVLAACALWSYRSLPAQLAGFAIPNLAAAAWLWREGALDRITSRFEMGTRLCGADFCRASAAECSGADFGWLDFMRLSRLPWRGFGSRIAAATAGNGWVAGVVAGRGGCGAAVLSKILFSDSARDGVAWGSRDLFAACAGSGWFDRGRAAGSRGSIWAAVFLLAAGTKRSG